jgi:hypothetical protein
MIMTKMEVLAALKTAGVAAAAAAKKYNEYQHVIPGMTLELEFVQYENPLVSANEIERWKYIDTFPCGLAWVTVSTYKHPKSKAFIKVLKDMGFVIEDTNGGRNEPELPAWCREVFRQDRDRHTLYSLSIHDFNQSMGLKTKYAKVFAEELSKLGICASHRNWID